MLRIKEIMREKKISNAEIARKLKVSPQYVSDVVNNHKNITLDVLSKFAEILSEPVVALFEGYNRNRCKPESQIICPFCSSVICLKNG